MRPHPIPPTQPTPTNISHTGHLIATILTFGIWAPFWALAAMNISRVNKNKQARYARELGEYESAKAQWQFEMNRTMNA